MANFPEQTTWESGVPFIDTTDDVMGGLDGAANKSAKALTNRTSYLKATQDANTALLRRFGIPATQAEAANPYGQGNDPYATFASDVAMFDVVYRDPADGVYKKALGNGVTAYGLVGIAIKNTAYSANYTVLAGIVKIATNYPAGTNLYVSATTAGAITAVKTKLFLGVSLGDYRIYVGGVGAGSGNEALIKSLSGIIPHGVFWGFKVSWNTGRTLSIAPDTDNYPVSIAAVERAGGYITFCRSSATHTLTVPTGVTGLRHICLHCINNPEDDADFVFTLESTTNLVDKVIVGSINITEETNALTQAMIVEDYIEVGNFNSMYMELLTSISQNKDQLQEMYADLVSMWDEIGKVSDKLSEFNDSLPTGTVIFHAADTAPNGMLVCDGSLVTRVSYAELFSVIGTTFNQAGDPASSFRLPNLLGEFIRGWDKGRGIDAGRVFGSFQMGTLIAADLAKFTPNLVTLYNKADDNADTAARTFSGDLAKISDYPAGVAITALSSGVYSESPAGASPCLAARPRNLALLPCIKY